MKRSHRESFDNVKQLLTPEQSTVELSQITNPKESIWRTSLLMRTIVGVLGIALPVILLAGDYFFLKGGIVARGSLSAYYHSGMRDVFVSILVAVAFALFVYKPFQLNLDNALSTLAGLAAVSVALFPTGTPGSVDPTPLQMRLNEDVVEVIHFISAAIFICSLAGICFLFGLREGRRSQVRNGRTASGSPEFWRTFHFVSAGAIVAAILLIVISELAGIFDDYSILIGESVAGLAFGASWLAKGLDWERLLGRP